MALLSIAGFALSVVLSVSPTLHERVHPDAQRSNHVCGVTLVASGGLQHSAAPPVIVAPSTTEDSAFVRVLASAWVASPFLSASIFEHAPPGTI
jgi:hypothetical protein